MSFCHAVRSATGTILSTVCLSVKNLWWCILWLNDTSYSKCLNKWIENFPRNTILQLSPPTPTLSLKLSYSPPQKLRNFTYLLCRFLDHVMLRIWESWPIVIEVYDRLSQQQLGFLLVLVNHQNWTTNHTHHSSSRWNDVIKALRYINQWMIYASIFKLMAQNNH